MRRFSVLVSALLILGCGGSDSEPLSLGPTDANIAGTYSLTLSAGRPLPVFGFATADEEFDIVSDQFVIGADNTWSETTNYIATAFATGATRTTSSQSAGTYAIGNAQINFTIVPGNIPFTGSVSGNTLSVLYQGTRFTYQR